MTLRRISTVFLVILLICSCSKKHDNYSFIALEGTAEEPAELKYDFLIDTLCVYDTFISCKFKAHEISESHIDLKITITDPSGVKGYDTVSFPMHSIKSDVSEKDGITIVQEGRYTDIEWPYRSNIKSDSTDNWIIEIDFISNPKGIYGIGFSYKDLQ